MIEDVLSFLKDCLDLFPEDEDEDEEQEEEPEESEDGTEEEEASHDEETSSSSEETDSVFSDPSRASTSATGLRSVTASSVGATASVGACLEETSSAAATEQPTDTHSPDVESPAVLPSPVQGTPLHPPYMPQARSSEAEEQDDEEAAMQPPNHEIQDVLRSCDRSAASARLMDEIMTAGVASNGLLTSPDNVTKRVRGDSTEMSFSTGSTHLSRFFDHWPYNKNSAPAAAAAAAKTAAVAAAAATTSAAVGDKKSKDHFSVIGNSTPTRPSFSPRASYFRISPIDAERPSMGTTVTIDDCRDVLQRISTSVSSMQAVVRESRSEQILVSPPGSHRRTPGNGTTEEDEQAFANDQEKPIGDAGTQSVSCQTEEWLEQSSWQTLSPSRGANDSLVGAIDRLCQEFSRETSSSSPSSSREEYVKAVRAILRPVVEEVVSEMRLNSKSF